MAWFMGTPEIGDELAIVPNPLDPFEAEMVINLEQMKGTWTFQVLPKLKPNPTKTEEEILAGMSDSMRLPCLHRVNMALH